MCYFDPISVCLERDQESSMYLYVMFMRISIIETKFYTGVCPVCPWDLNLQDMGADRLH